MTAKRRGIHFCYQKHFLFFRRRRDLFHAHLCAVLLLVCSLLAYAWPWHCAGLSLAFRKIIESVVVFWHGFFFLFAELVQYKKHCTFTLRNTLRRRHNHPKVATSVNCSNNWGPDRPARVFQVDLVQQAQWSALDSNIGSTTSSWYRIVFG